jgi:D-alanyl-D-alanine carboxypeptidase/D-alanyl-D-alanine-endopeptidase (penicillin-binding protein 4)
VDNYWSNKSIDLTGFNMEDGSGLSRLNVFTPKQMCLFLNYEMRQPSFKSFKNSLPIAGQTGTLKTVADDTIAEGKIFAKSGSMSKVRSYSGYVQTKSGDLLSFCIIINNYTCGTAEIRSKLEKLMVWMAGL